MIEINNFPESGLVRRPLVCPSTHLLFLNSWDSVPCPHMSVWWRVRGHTHHLRAESLPGLHSVVYTGRLSLLPHQDVEDVPCKASQSSVGEAHLFYTFSQLYHDGDDGPVRGLPGQSPVAPTGSLGDKPVKCQDEGVLTVAESDKLHNES